MKMFTLGYEKRNVQEFIEILKEANVQTLVDVRETAWSYKRDFCKTKFKNALSDAGIDYIHLKELGNPKEIRRSGVTSVSILKKYRRYLKDTSAGIPELLTLLESSKQEKKNICLTCYEKDHRDCHRSIISEHVFGKVTGKIVHL